MNTRNNEDNAFQEKEKEPYKKIFWISTLQVKKKRGHLELLAQTLL